MGQVCPRETQQLSGPRARARRKRSDRRATRAYTARRRRSRTDPERDATQATSRPDTPRLGPARVWAHVRSLGMGSFTGDLCPLIHAPGVISQNRENPPGLSDAPRKNRALTIFYGYPAPLIATWCCVSLSTAHAYKSGGLKPSRLATRLFELHRDRRVLGPEWKGWLIKPDCIVDPEGNETNRKQLRMFRLMMQYAHDLACRTGDEREVDRYYELLKAA